MRIAILSNVTVEVLAGMLRRDHQLWLPSGYGAWVQTALNPPEELRAFAPELICLLLDAKFGTYDPELKAQATESLAANFPGVSLLVPELEGLAQDFGESFYDARMWKLGSMPWSLKGLKEIQKIFGLKKVLALDLDNTLWEGVVGEDGVSGIVPKVEFQRQLLKLKSRGVLLTIVSKNNPADVEPVWEDSRMVLKRGDFVAAKINWEAKADNLGAIAKELNLGADAIVFVDDNPAERAEMRARCPEVCVAAFPPQLELYFPARQVTAEDLHKTEQYQAEAARRKFAAGLSVDNYLKGLELKGDIHLALVTEVPRIAQLAGKTNQFNVTTHRYSEDEVRKFVASDDVVLSAHSLDRFGDQGLVAFVRVTCADGVATIVDFVMSCRVMNRTLEFAIEEYLEAELKRRGIDLLRATYCPTAKNAPVKGLFDKLGFAALGEGQYEKRLACAEPLAHWYRVGK